jgi:hypothetical protein
MLRIPMLGRSRSNTIRGSLFAVLPALIIGSVASAQQEVSPQQQEQQTPTAPAQPQQPASAGPSPSEAPASNSTTSATELPQIVVAGATPKPKPKRSAQATQPTAQNAPAPPQDVPTPQQAALNANMTKMNEARDRSLLPKIGATTYTFTREAIVSCRRAIRLDSSSQSIL